MAPAINANADLGEALMQLSDEALEALESKAGGGKPAKKAKKTPRKKAGKRAGKRAAKKTGRKRAGKTAKKAAKKAAKATKKASASKGGGSKGATQADAEQTALIEKLAKSGTKETADFQEQLAGKFPNKPRLNGNSIQAIARRAVAG
jgi:hypothetical protein